MALQSAAVQTRSFDQREDMKVNQAFCDINIYEQSSQTIVLQLNGEFDLVREPALQGALDGLCQEPERSLAVDLAKTQFIGVGCLRRIVLAGREFSSTEFRSPPPIVEKMLEILGFIDDTVRIDGGTASVSVDGACAVVQQNESQRNASEKEWPAPQASRRCPEAWGPSNLRSSGRGVRAFGPPPNRCSADKAACLVGIDAQVATE